MSRLTYLVLFLFSTTAFSQIPAYYSEVDFTLTGMALKSELSDLVTSTHTSPTSYSEVWDVLKSSDLDPDNSSNVLLVYGYNDDDGNVVTDRTRNKESNGGSPGDWNREHVFPKSLGSPDLGTSGPGSDPHNLRSSDVQANGNRSNRMYRDGSGNASAVSSGWYPGDEWRGDVARIVMYMYLRYGNRCLPSYVTVGTTNSIDPAMIDLLLEWNQEDDVSDFEINRNNKIQDAIGNRNPFIDNPYIATQIWGGPEATDTWGGLDISTVTAEPTLSVYPNPTVDGDITITYSVGAKQISCFNLAGEMVYSNASLPQGNTPTLTIDDLPSGIVFVQVQTAVGILTEKVIVH